MLCVLRNLEENGESGTQALMLEKGWWQGLAQLLVRQKTYVLDLSSLSPFYSVWSSRNSAARS